MKSINLAVSAYFEYQIIILYPTYDMWHVPIVYLIIHWVSLTLELVELTNIFPCGKQNKFSWFSEHFLLWTTYLVVIIYKNIICNPISSFRTCVYPWLKLFSDTCAPHVIMTFLIYWAYQKIKLPCNTKDTNNLWKTLVCDTCDIVK